MGLLYLVFGHIFGVVAWSIKSTFGNYMWVYLNAGAALILLFTYLTSWFIVGIILALIHFITFLIITNSKPKRLVREVANDLGGYDGF